MQDHVGFHNKENGYHTQIPNCVIDAKIGTINLAVYTVIKRIAGSSGVCFMSLKNLAEKCEVGLTKLQECLASLCSVHKSLGCSLLTKTSRKKENGSRDTCVYEINDIWPLNMQILSQNKFGMSPRERGVCRHANEGMSPRDNKEDTLKNIPLKKEEDVVKKKTKSSSSSISIDKQKKSFSGIPSESMELWKSTFVGLNVEQELKECFTRAVVRDPRDDWTSFILNWLQNSMKRVKENPPEKIAEQALACQKNRDKLEELLEKLQANDWTFVLLDDRLEYHKKNTKIAGAIFYDSVSFTAEVTKLRTLMDK